MHPAEPSLSDFDTSIRDTGIEKRGTIITVTILLWIAAVFNMFIFVVIAVNGTLETLVRLVGLTWNISMITPLAVMLTAAAFKRGPGALMWVSLFAGGLLAVTAPLILFIAGYAGDTEIILAGRRGSSDFSLQGLLWLNLPTAAVLLGLGVLNFIGWKRHRARLRVTPHVSSC